MNSIDFCFWLQGFFEIGEGDGNGINQRQLQTIKDHLHLVFKHEIDPRREAETTTPASVLNQTHSGNDTLIRC